MSVLCADHQGEAIDTCGICQRPLCQRCVRLGPLPKCAKCIAEDEALPGKKNFMVGRSLILVTLIMLGLLFWLCGGCEEFLRTHIHT